MLTTTGGVIESSVGYVYWDFDPQDNSVEIHNLYVAPASRNKGYARQLLQSAIPVIQKQYPNLQIKIFVGTKDNSVSQERLARFYAALGLQVIQGTSEKEGKEAGK